MSPTISANGSGQISWSFTSQCGTPLGTYNIWVRDDSNGKTSNTVQEIVTQNSSCTPDPTLMVDGGIGGNEEEPTVAVMTP